MERDTPVTDPSPDPSPDVASVRDKLHRLRAEKVVVEAQRRSVHDAYEITERLLADLVRETAERPPSR